MGYCFFISYDEKQLILVTFLSTVFSLDKGKNAITFSTNAAQIYLFFFRWKGVTRITELWISQVSLSRQHSLYTFTLPTTLVYHLIQKGQCHFDWSRMSLDGYSINSLFQQQCLYPSLATQCTCRGKSDESMAECWAALLSLLLFAPGNPSSSFSRIWVWNKKC